MKIAVTSSGRTLRSRVDQRFGRAPYFIVYDTEFDEWSVYDNEQNANAAMGAGIRAGHNIVAMEVDAVITGHCGTWAFPILEAAGVDVYVGAEGTVRKAIDAFKADRLTQLISPSVAAGYRGK